MLSRLVLALAIAAGPLAPFVAAPAHAAEDTTKRLKEIERELKARADRLSTELAGLAQVRVSLDRERRAAAVTRDELARRQGDVQALVAKREDLLKETEVERDQALGRLKQLAEEASDLRDLM